MLRHTYDLPHESHLLQAALTLLNENPLSFHLILYILADKYDIPSLRTLTCDVFMERMYHMQNHPTFTSAMKRLFAYTMADCSLQDAAFGMLGAKMWRIVKDNGGFVEEVLRGEVFDAEVVGRLVVAVARQEPRMRVSERGRGGCPDAAVDVAASAAAAVISNW